MDCPRISGAFFYIFLEIGYLTYYNRLKTTPFRQEMADMKRYLFGLLAGAALLLAACSAGDDKCEHRYTDWNVEKPATCTSDGIQSRECRACGEDETQIIAAQGHTEALILAQDATCTKDGQTEGKVCSICEEVLVESTLLPALGHTEVVDAAAAATCTESGLTEGRHCTVCSEILTAQETIPATGHSYSTVVTTQASCKQSGTKTTTCAICADSYTEDFALPELDATSIYDQSGPSIGEIVVYDRNGDEFAMGTGFLYTADGQIITNYHVIEDACSAKITINGESYDVQYVLAYDKTIDLAVLQISGSFTPLPICYESHEVGKPVYAFGSSRGLTATFSQGIITYAQREVDGVMHVQHDAAISGGNSGGPLIDRFGHVIGINTWTVRDSQNLNFAIATTEIKNLIFGEKMTMAQVFDKESDTFKKLKNYITTYGDLDEDGDYTLFLGSSYSSDYTNEYIRLAIYTAEDNSIQLGLMIDDRTLMYLDIYEVGEIYDWVYYDEDEYIMVGTVRATAFDADSTLSYDDHNISNTYLCSSIQSLSSSMLKLMLVYLEDDLADIGITPSDLYFVNF